MDDSNIVDLYLSRDESAIFHTAKKYGRKLKQIANNILHDMETSEECENETYLRAWNSIPPNEPRTFFLLFSAKSSDISQLMNVEKTRPENAWNCF